MTESCSGPRDATHQKFAIPELDGNALTSNRWAATTVETMDLGRWPVQPPIQPSLRCCHSTVRKTQSKPVDAYWPVKIVFQVNVSTLLRRLISFSSGLAGCVCLNARA